MRTQVDHEGVGPSSTNIWNQPGGDVFASGGAVTVQVTVPGGLWLWFIVLPRVLDTAARRGTSPAP